MTEKEFEDIFERRIQLMKSVMLKKKAEYATEVDRLHNFDRAAKMLNCTKAQALMGMLSKHLVSILDIVDARKPVTIEVIEEKIGDAINYLSLLEAILKENAAPGF